MKKATTAFGLLIVMSLFSLSFAQTTTYQSSKSTMCSWNSETQVKDICREVMSNVQIEVNQSENSIFITTDGDVSVFHIENITNSGGMHIAYSLISADGTSWKMIIEPTNNIIWMDLVNDTHAESISYSSF